MHQGQQQQQQHQIFFQQQQQQFNLPFGNKPAQNGPAASSTPAPSPLLNNNFHIMPMNLMSSLYPWKQFDGYVNNNNGMGVAGNFIRQKFFLAN